MNSEIKLDNDIINYIVEVFENEIEALSSVKSSLKTHITELGYKKVNKHFDYDFALTFENAVKLLQSCNGKVILTGLGKSGHIAKKISATFSSTGTKSVYLHPVEAIHGDLGIVEKNDCVIMLSKSGKSEELLYLLPFFKRFNIPIISITSNPDSKLAKNSDITLHMNIKKEACPLDLAPTTSTTVSLVIGDALAVALMKLNNFKKENFAIFHPGGQLGKRLLIKVKDIMWSGSDNPLVYIDEEMREVILKITSKRLGAVSVVDKESMFKGLITDYDIRIHLNREIFDKKAEDIMNTSPTFIYEDTMASEALILMENRKNPFNVLPVLDKNHKAVGMIRLHDLVKLGL